MYQESLIFVVPGNINIRYMIEPQGNKSSRKHWGSICYYPTPSNLNNMNKLVLSTICRRIGKNKVCEIGDQR